MPNNTPPNLQKNNADIARQQAAQDISGQSTVTGEFEEASTALDKLAEVATKKAAAAAQPSPDDVDAPSEPKVEPAAGADDTAAQETAKKLADEEAAKKKADEERASQARKADEYFKDSPSLPSGASPKSAEAFAAVKIRAAQEISARESELEKLRTELGELKQAVGKLTPEQEQALKELEDHRAWRAKLDVEFDPKFKEYDKQVAAAHEFIYAQLRKSPAVSDETIEQIKKHGGPENIKLDKLFEAIDDPTLQRLVEAKVADIAQTKWAKEQAIKSAKDNISGYLSEREKAWQTAAVSHTQATQGTLKELLGKLDWYAEKTPAATATDDEKKAAVEHNKFVSELRGQIDAAVKDDSPQMRAVLITGMAQLFYLQNILPAKDARIATLEKQLAEVSEKWEKVKNGSVSRLRESSAPSNGQLPAKQPDIFNTRPGDALDAIAKRISEERAAKGVA